MLRMNTYQQVMHVQLLKLCKHGHDCDIVSHFVSAFWGHVPTPCWYVINDVCRQWIDAFSHHYYTRLPLRLMLMVLKMMMPVGVTSLLLIVSIFCSAAWAGTQQPSLYSTIINFIIIINHRHQSRQERCLYIWWEEPINWKCAIFLSTVTVVNPG